MNNKKEYSIPDFDEYIRQGEPEKQEKAYTWQTAIGLQAVDGLKTSEYLLETARQHIEGHIDINKAQELLKTYYLSKKVRTPEDSEMEEADKVAANITKVLSTRTLAFNTNGYLAVHRHIFEGVFKFAGHIRDYDITKKEWILHGDTVSYMNNKDIRRALDYDILQEKEFDYTNLHMNEVIKHLMQFVSGLWQIHAFGEGNTRTTAVFTIQYLRSIGFDINNDMFALHSWYFRNALVRANYKNAQKRVMYNFTYLERFFRNLLMGENNELKNRHMVIDIFEEENKKETSTGQVQDKYEASKSLVEDKFHTDIVEIIQLVKAIGTEQLSLKQMMETLSLKGRDNFIKLYLLPSLNEGFVKKLYPDRPNHPRQKYLLTVKGLALYNE